MNNILCLVIVFLVLFNKLILNISLVKNNLIPFRTLFSLEFNTMKQIYNPSVVKLKNKYVYCARVSNSTSKNIVRYCMGNIFFKSNIIFFETNLQHKNIKIINVTNPLNEVIEDPRIIEYNNMYYISCVVVKNSLNIFPTILVYDKEYNFIKRIKYIGYDKGNSNIHKNWCPFTHKGELLIHTDSYPIWKVYKLKDNGNMSLLVHKDVRNFFTILSDNIYLRCSTSWKRFSYNKYICALHIKKGFYKHRTMFDIYRTMFVIIDIDTLLPIQCTDKMSIDKLNNRIQFCSGLEVDKTNIVVSYGIGDYKAVVSKIRKKDILHFCKLCNKNSSIRTI